MPWRSSGAAARSPAKARSAHLLRRQPAARAGQIRPGVSRPGGEAGTPRGARTSPSVWVSNTRLRPLTFLWASYPRGPACGPVRTDWVSRMPAEGRRLRPRTRRGQPFSTARARSSAPSRTQRSSRLPIVRRGGQEPRSSFHAAPARHSRHSAWSMVRVDHRRGRPVLAGGSIASMVAARRTVVFARTTSLMAGAYRRRCSDVQDIFGIPRGKPAIWAPDVRAERRPDLLPSQGLGCFRHGSHKSTYGSSPWFRSRYRLCPSAQEVDGMGELPRSLPEFEARFPDDAACARWLMEKRWPDGFRCPACGHDKGW